MPWVRLSTIIPFDSDSQLDMFTIRTQGLVASVNQSTRLSANLSELDEENNTAITQVRTIQLCTWPEQMFNLTRILLHNNGSKVVLTLQGSAVEHQIVQCS